MDGPWCSLAGIEESVSQKLVGYIALVGGVDKSKDVESLEDYIGGFAFGTRYLTHSYLV